ncbi:hypothetical protein ACJIZ3_001183 [Penstemon smallii]|uniref:Isopenicillin N synthase-like Fe(2+) 2OG dioxygenase domain-containing protein n=1 Tax=Penstemon smallii TaxID=265156 RepID=A0ABD3U449_9LAMI
MTATASHVSNESTLNDDSAYVKVLAESSTLKYLINHGIIDASLEFFERKSDCTSQGARRNPIKSGTGSVLNVANQRIHLWRDYVKSYAISENLGLEQGYIDNVLKLDSCFQLYAANYYPPCPEPDQAIVAGLQIQHNGKWFNTNSPQNSILVNAADHLEIFSNGRYKSVKHRAVVNSEATRISVVNAIMMVVLYISQ